VAVLRAVPEAVGPAYGEAQYSLGLVLAELGRMPEAADALRQAAARLDRARVHYNLGLALQALGRPAGAEEALQRAHALDGRDVGVVQALVLLYLRQGTPDRAVPWAERLVLLTNGDPEARRLLEAVRAGSGPR
jgi:tetratricopeptide (TPR) repeat protein